MYCLTVKQYSTWLGIAVGWSCLLVSILVIPHAWLSALRQRPCESLRLSLMSFIRQCLKVDNGSLLSHLLQFIPHSPKSNVRLCGLEVRSWQQIQRSEFDSRHHLIFWVVHLERGPLSLMSTNGELLERKSRAPVSKTLVNLSYGRRGSAALTTRQPSIFKSWR
jgi:hypothetical protein